MKISTALKSAREIIATESAWCQGARAKNREGREVDVMSDSATSFCSLGAIYRAVGSEDVNVDKHRAIMDAALNDLTKIRVDERNINFVGYNERYKHADIIKVFDVAIAKAETDEALIAAADAEPERISVMKAQVGV